MTIDEMMELLTLVKPAVEGAVRSSNVVMQCPFAAVSGHRHTVDRTPSLGILPDTAVNGGTWNCFSCGRKGSIEQLFRMLEQELGYDCTMALSRLQAILYLSPEEIVAAVPPYESHYLDPGEPYRTFPDSWLAPYGGRTAQQLLDRGVTLETCKAWDVGFDRPNQRITYPVRDSEGRLVGLVGGTVRKKQEWEDGFVKYKNYWSRVHNSCGFSLSHRDGQYYCPNCGNVAVRREHALEGFRKAQHLFGSQFFHGAEAVAIVVEGVVDALKVWQATADFRLRGRRVLPLALLGSKPSQAQADIIVRLTVDRTMISFLDDDVSGKGGDLLLHRLLGQRLRFFRAAYPQETSGADPGSLTEQQICQAVTDAKVILRE
jgi:predicted RNA-binding Zn-ribbon protein involved in translation (DUF1610 family)